MSDEIPNSHALLLMLRHHETVCSVEWRKSAQGMN